MSDQDRRHKKEVEDKAEEIRKTIKVSHICDPLLMSRTYYSVNSLKYLELVSVACQI